MLRLSVGSKLTACDQHDLVIPFDALLTRKERQVVVMDSIEVIPDAYGASQSRSTLFSSATQTHLPG